IPDLVAAVKDAHKKCVLVGHSLGGLVSMGVAAKVPELITAIVMLDPPGPGFLARLDSSPDFTIWSAMRKFAGRKDVPGVAKALADLQVPTAAPGETRRLGDMRDAASLRYMARCLQDLDPEAMTPALEKKWLEGFDVFAIAKQVKCPAMLV